MSYRGGGGKFSAKHQGENQRKAFWETEWRHVVSTARISEKERDDFLGNLRELWERQIDTGGLAGKK